MSVMSHMHLCNFEECVEHTKQPSEDNATLNDKIITNLELFQGFICNY